MSDSELLNPVLNPAFADLKRLVHHLGDELASYRRRALSAEAKLKALEERVADASASGGPSLEDSLALRQENAELQERLKQAEDQTTALLNRVRFLRQQREGVA